jgi:uncharacterized protein YkwD
MNAKLTTFIVLLALILTSCGSKAPAETAVPAVTNTRALVATNAPATEAPVITDTPVASTEITATVSDQPTVTSEPRPTNVAGCTNSAAFVADITIPDNTQLAGGEEFVKTWRIGNNGTCIWASDYKLVYYSDERMNAPAEVPLAITYPGQTLDVSVKLTAPNSIGVHRANFVIEKPDGLAMKIADDSRLWLIINVGSTVAPTAGNTATAGAVSVATNAPAANPTVPAGGSGLVNVTCGYAIDQAKLIEMINAVNAYRAQSGGMFAYPVNQQLARAAQAHANDMACNSLSTNTGSNGSTVDTRVAASGYTASFAGQNVYVINPPISGQDVVNKWINDTVETQNKLNLVSDTFTEFGVGYAFFNNTGYYVIVFAAPK